MRLQKDKIVQRAIEVLDRDGLDGVTLRRLAKELDVQAGSIYYYIPNKDTLLSEMANMILAARFANFDFKNYQRGWAEWLDTLAHELRTAMLAHREGARVVAGAHPHIALMLLTLWDMSVRVLHNNNFSYSKAMTVTATIMNFTFGSVIEEQASPPLGQMPPVLSPEALLLVERFPALAAIADVWMVEDNDMRFDTSVRIIIDGVRAVLDAQSTNAE